MYVACQNREGDLEEFFAHDNHAYPQSLLIYSEIRLTDKSDTIKIFENLVETFSVKPDFQRSIRWCCCGASSSSEGLNHFWAVLQERVTAYLFKKYRQSTINRAYIFWDIYLDHSIKNSTRIKRGFGMQIKVAGSTSIPRH